MSYGTVSGNHISIHFQSGVLLCDKSLSEYTFFHPQYYPQFFLQTIFFASFLPVGSFRLFLCLHLTYNSFFFENKEKTSLRKESISQRTTVVLFCLRFPGPVMCKVFWHRRRHTHTKGVILLAKKSLLEKIKKKIIIKKQK